MSSNLSLIRILIFLSPLSKLNIELNYKLASLPLYRHSSHGEHTSHDGEVSHEAGGLAEGEAEHPVPGEQEIQVIMYYLGSMNMAENC